MSTNVSARPLLDGRFAHTFTKYQSLDPHSRTEAWRYLTYNVCAFALLCLGVPGDFLFGGVAWGATARITFEFTDLGKSNKTLHLVDPFDARTSILNPTKTATYNSDPDYVRNQYPMDARVIIHRQLIPISVGPLAFVFLDTGDYDAHIAALPAFYRDLSPGGIIVCGRYADFSELYEPVLRQLGTEAIWLPSGQCVIIKS